MPVNFGLLQPVQPASAFFQGQQDVRAEQERNMLRAAQMEQMAFQRENMMAQRQERAAHAQQRMQEEAESKRRREALDKAAEVLGKAGANLDLPTLNQGLAFALQSGNTVAAQTMSKLRDDFVAQARYEQEQQRIFGGPTTPAAAAPANALAAPVEGGPTPMFAAPPVNALTAPPAAAALPPGITRERVQQMMMSRSPEMQAQGRALAATLEKEPSTPDVATMRALGFPITPQGYADYRKAQREEKAYEPSELQKTLDDLRKAPPGSPEAQALQNRLRILTTREPKEPKEPSAPIAVVDEATGKVKYVSREEAIGKTPPSAMEGLAPKEIQRREAVFPQAKQSVATVTSTMTEVENTIDRLLKNPKGLNGITGLVYGRTPALTDDARRAESDLKQLRNLAFVQGLTELRAASKTGAGVGNVSNKEGDRFENLKASLETTQSFDDMVAALKRLKAQTSATKTNLQTEFEDMYSYRQGRQSAPAPAPGAPTPAGFPAPPQGAIDALKRGQGTDAQFDAIFGPGAAARARRQ